MSSFLDKYLSKDKKKKKRPKDGKKFKGGGLRIVDEDGFGFGDQQKVDTSDDETAEELPQIAALVDERPREAQLLDEIKQGKWKQLETVDTSRSRRHDSDSSEDEDGTGVQETRRRHDSSGSSDVSPPRRRRHDSDQDGDISPPRQRRRHDSEDLSPPRQRQRHDSGDLSPPRISKQRHDSGDLSPPRRQRHDSGDLSPPRRRRHDSGDLSPPRRQSNHQHSRKQHGDDDLSPPRNPRESSSRDNRRGSQPDRFNRHQSHQSNSTRRDIAIPEIIEESKNSLSSTTLDGKRAGLQRASDLRNEMVDYRKRENEMFSNLDDEVSGRNAVTKLRDRTTGRERDLAAEMAKKAEEDKVAAEKKLLYDKWGKGLKQVEEYSTKLNEALHETSKPLARYSDDQDLDDYLKHQERDGDPMLKFLSAKKRGGAGSGKPVYQGPPPLPNRFAIPPGHRWDGVDRSGGYEKEWFSRINSRKALEEEAYKWSVEDL